MFVAFLFPLSFVPWHEGVTDENPLQRHMNMPSASSQVEGRENICAFNRTIEENQELNVSVDPPFFLLHKISKSIITKWRTPKIQTESIKSIMRFSTLISALLISSAAAFTSNTPFVRVNHASPLSMSTEAVNYVISGNNIEVTTALSEYVETKLDRTVGKLSASGAVQECDVHLTVNKNPKVCDEWWMLNSIVRFWF